MPSRNTVREDAANSYYHVYARGANKQLVFLDDTDHQYFQKLIARYLATEAILSKSNYTYPSYSEGIQLLAYCQMDNHFHLLAYQEQVGTLSAFMKSLMTSYSMYFNLRYKHSGSVFESRFKSSRITQQSYLEHISRYIHMNPRNWRTYKYSSLKFYRGETAPKWLEPKVITDLFEGPDDYDKFMRDYEASKEMLQEIKYDLADAKYI